MIAFTEIWCSDDKADKIDYGNYQITQQYIKFGIAFKKEDV